MRQETVVQLPEIQYNIRGGKSEDGQRFSGFLPEHCTKYKEKGEFQLLQAGLDEG